MPCEQTNLGFKRWRDTIVVVLSALSLSASIWRAEKGLSDRRKVPYCCILSSLEGGTLSLPFIPFIKRNVVTVIAVRGRRVSALGSQASVSPRFPARNFRALVPNTGTLALQETTNSFRISRDEGPTMVKSKDNDRINRRGRILVVGALGGGGIHHVKRKDRPRGEERRKP